MRLAIAMLLVTLVCGSPAFAEEAWWDKGLATISVNNGSTKNKLIQEQIKGFGVQLSPLIYTNNWYRHIKLGARVAFDFFPPGDFSSFSRAGIELGYARSKKWPKKLVKLGLGGFILLEKWSIFRESYTDPNDMDTNNSRTVSASGRALGIGVRGWFQLWRLQFALRFETGTMTGTKEPLLAGRFTTGVFELGLTLF